jgi:hypothetical protein
MVAADSTTTGDRWGVISPRATGVPRSDVSLELSYPGNDLRGIGWPRGPTRPGRGTWSDRWCDSVVDFAREHGKAREVPQVSTASM